MPRTDIEVQDFPGSSVAAAVIWTDFDTVNGMAFECDSRKILLVRNSNVTTATVTVLAVPLQNFTEGDVALVVATDAQLMHGPHNPDAFRQPDGMVHLDCEEDCEVAVLQWPF